MLLEALHRVRRSLPAGRGHAWPAGSRAVRRLRGGIRYALQRVIVPLAAPLAVLALAAWAQSRVAHLSPTARDAIRFAPWTAIGIGAALSLVLNRGRAFLGLFMVGLVYLATGPRAVPAADDALTRTLFAALIHFVPANLLLLSLADERRAFTMAGWVRLSVVLLQIYVAWLLVKFGPAGLGCGGDEVLHVPGLARGLQVVCALLITARTLARPSAADVSFTGALLACVLAGYVVNVPYAFAIYVTAAAAILDLGIVLGLHELAYRDELTGLAGRRAFEEELAALDSRYAIAMVDVDHFKQFNDTHGHLVGDDVLRFVATRLRGVTGARAFRYGGEEFALVFRGQGAEDARSACERLREGIAGYVLTPRAPQRPRHRRQGRRMRVIGVERMGVSVTVSVGVAESGPRTEAPHEVVAAADRALYRAKEGGRNRVAR